MSSDHIEMINQYFIDLNKRNKGSTLNPKAKKIECFRRRTVRALIEECGLTPNDAGKEYSRRTLDYNIAADYAFTEETLADARKRIVKTYEEGL